MINQDQQCENIFNFFLFKIASRCNLNCSYCYEYNSFDISWKRKPKFMSYEVLTKSVLRVKNHVVRHQLTNITIVFHGGEPLLIGEGALEKALDLIQEKLSPLCRVKLGLQTNGILLNENWLNLFKNRNVGIGLSIDGDKKSNDKARLTHSGESSFVLVEKALDLLKREGTKFGILTVMDIESDPIKTFNFLRQFQPFQIEFLFPHQNHVNPPKLHYCSVKGYGYGEWLSRVFDYWWKNDLSEVNIRIFSDIIHLLMGGKYATESLGLAPVGIAAIQTDGLYEAVDSLKSTYDGAVQTGKSVFDSDIDDIMSYDLIGTRIDRINNLCDECSRCKFVKVCGGGYLPHRYHPKNFFNAPSIYCQDLKYIINHIANTLLSLEDPSFKARIINNLEALIKT